MKSMRTGESDDATALNVARGYTGRASVFRWALVLPAALVGFAVAQTAVIVVTAFIPWSVVSRQVSALVTPIGFVLLGARVAPRFKLHTAAILAVIAIFLAGMVLAVALLTNAGPSAQEQLIGALLGVVGAICGIYVVYQQERVIALG